MSVRLLFEMRDLWVGVFWRYASWPAERDEFLGQLHDEGYQLEIFIGLLPCLPIRLRFGDFETFGEEFVG